MLTRAPRAYRVDQRQSKRRACPPEAKPSLEDYSVSSPPSTGRATVPPRPIARDLATHLRYKRSWAGRALPILDPPPARQTLTTAQTGRMSRSLRSRRRVLLRSALSREPAGSSAEFERSDRSRRSAGRAAEPREARRPLVTAPPCRPSLAGGRVEHAAELRRLAAPALSPGRGSETAERSGRCAGAGEVVGQTIAGAVVGSNGLSWSPVPAPLA